MPNRLSKLRNMAGLMRVDIAARMRVSERTVERWEEGKTGIPDERKLQLAEMFDVSPAYLMGWEDEAEAVAARPGGRRS